MELRGDKFHSGGLYLRRESFTKVQGIYPWDYWIGLSLWTGEWLYFKNGVDFGCGPKAFRSASFKAAEARGLKHKATLKDMPVDEIKVVWYDEIGERAQAAATIPTDLMNQPYNPKLLEDPEFRRMVGLE